MAAKKERYNYLLVEYLKEMSNETTYLLLIITSLLLYILVSLFEDRMASSTIGILGITSPNLLRIVFILLMLGGFILFTITSFSKRDIEKQLEDL